MECGTSSGQQLRRRTTPIEGIRLLENGLLDLSVTQKHLVEVAKRNAIESPLLRLPAEIRKRIFEFASSGYNIKIGYDTSTVRPSDLGNYPHQALTIISEYKLGDRKKHVIKDCKESPFYLPRVCRMAYSESVTKGYALNGLYIHAATFSRLSLGLPRIGAWAKSLLTAQFHVISRITVSAEAYIPYLGYSYMCGRSAISAKFPHVKYIYACGSYTLSGFASWVWSKERAIEELDSLIYEDQIRHRYAGWSCDQFVARIRQVITEVEGECIEFILNGSSTDLSSITEG